MWFSQAIIIQRSWHCVNILIFIPEQNRNTLTNLSVIERILLRSCPHTLIIMPGIKRGEINSDDLYEATVNKSEVRVLRMLDIYVKHLRPLKNYPALGLTSFCCSGGYIPIGMKKFTSVIMKTALWVFIPDIF